MIYTMALMYKDKSMAKRLYLNGMRVNTDERSRIPMSFAIQTDDIDFLSFLLNNAADPNLCDFLKNYPIHEACEWRQPEMVKLLIKAKADLNVQNESSETPLMLSINESDYETAKLLIRSGADLNKKNRAGNTALHLMAGCKAPDKTGLIGNLIIYGAKIDATNSKNETPLHLAVNAGNSAAVLLLLECGAKVDLRDQSGKSCVEIAIETKNREIIGLFE